MEIGLPWLAYTMMDPQAESIMGWSNSGVNNEKEVMTAEWVANSVCHEHFEQAISLLENGNLQDDLVIIGSETTFLMKAKLLFSSLRREGLAQFPFSGPTAYFELLSLAGRWRKGWYTVTRICDSAWENFCKVVSGEKELFLLPAVFRTEDHWLTLFTRAI